MLSGRESNAGRLMQDLQFPRRRTKVEVGHGRRQAGELARDLGIKLILQGRELGRQGVREACSIAPGALCDLVACIIVRFHYVNPIASISQWQDCVCDNRFMMHTVCAIDTQSGFNIIREDSKWLSHRSCTLEPPSS